VQVHQRIGTSDELLGAIVTLVRHSFEYVTMEEALTDASIVTYIKTSLDAASETRMRDRKNWQVLMWRGNGCQFCCSSVHYVSLGLWSDVTLLLFYA
jgi:hypothetical protein